MAGLLVPVRARRSPPGREATVPAPQYIACDGMDFGWTAIELRRFVALWESGTSIWDIADTLRRDPDEVALLVIDQARCGQIRARKG